MVDAHKATAAGVLYPADGPTLSRTIRSLLDEAPSSGISPRVVRPRALVVPHGMYGAAGAVAAAGWARVAALDKQVRRIVLLGPAHHTVVSGVVAPFAEGFETPLGIAPVDRIAIELSRRFPQFAVCDVPYDQEHALQVQLPFVQTLFKDAIVVPLIIGEGDDNAAAEVISAMWDDKTLVVVSTDLSHYFDAEAAECLDQATAVAIESLESAEIGETQACGHAALRALLTAARGRDMRGARVDLRHSGETTGNLLEVVGFWRIRHRLRTWMTTITAAAHQEHLRDFDVPTKEP